MATVTLVFKPKHDTIADTIHLFVESKTNAKIQDWVYRRGAHEPRHY